MINIGCGWVYDVTSFLVRCWDWYRQPQPANHEDRVQDHASCHPPHDHQFPYSQFAARSPQMCLCLLFPCLKAFFFLLSITRQAVFTYWLTSNCFSLGQVLLLRLPAIREKLNIPERIKHPASALPQNDGFIQSMKKGEFLYAGLQYLVIHEFNLRCCVGWKDAQLAQQLEERERRIKNHLDLAAKGQSHCFSFFHISAMSVKCLSKHYLTSKRWKELKY